MKYIRYGVSLLVLALVSFWAMLSIYNHARTDAINQLYIQETSLAQQAARGIVSYFEYYKEILVFFVSNQDVIHNDPAGQTLLREYFASQSGNITNITRISAAGQILYSYPDETVIGRDVSQQAHIQELLTNHKPVISDVFLTAQGYRSIAFHIPVFDQDGFAGSLAILIPFEKISKRFVENIHIGETGYALLLSADGTELYCPIPGHSGESAFDNIIDIPETSATMQKIVAGIEGRYAYEYNQSGLTGAPKLLKFGYAVPVHLESTYWVILVSTPEEEALAFIKGMRDRWTLAMGVLVAAFSLWGFFLVRAYLSLHRGNLLRQSQEKIAAVENEREKALALLDAAVMQSPSGVAIANAPDLSIQLINPAARRLRGINTQPISGGKYKSPLNWQTYRPDGSLYAPEDLPLVRAIQKGETINGEEVIIRDENGQDRWIFTNASPVRDHAGQVTAGIVILQDVTERKQAEDEILSLNATLERRVEQRTAELEAANNQLESFSYSVSHDLRAPLRSINGFTHVLADSLADRLTPEEQHHLERIFNATQRMNELIDGLLQFSRIGRKNLAVTPLTSADLAELVCTVQEEILSTETGRDIVWDIRPLAGCFADPVLLRQIWANLLSNAVKYTRGRAPARIEIGMAETEKGPAYFVRDNGVGFDMQYAERLFGVFQRMHAAGDFEGTGIGLALTQRIVHRHNGVIWAESRVDQGSTFYFTLA